MSSKPVGYPKCSQLDGITLFFSLRRIYCSAVHIHSVLCIYLGKIDKKSYPFLYPNPPVKYIINRAAGLLVM